jgi:hypothetical protein
VRLCPEGYPGWRHPGKPVLAWALAELGHSQIKTATFRGTVFWLANYEAVPFQQFSILHDARPPTASACCSRWGRFFWPLTSLPSGCTQRYERLDVGSNAAR